jgi:cbb3-type cytochrome oxidase subunit 3
MGALANYVVCIIMNIQPPAMYILTAGGLLGFSLLETWIYAAQKKKELDSNNQDPLLDNEDPEVDQNAEDE